MNDAALIAELPYPWEKLDGKTLLISGGTGFIGSNMIDVVRYRNEKFGAGIRVISVSRRGGISDDTVEHLQADITKSIVYDGPIDFILHLASNTHPKQYSEDPIGTITTNVFGCDNLLQLAHEKNARFLLASSVEIYGQGTDVPMDEMYCGYINCNNARNGYNESKRTCEALCQAYRQQYHVDAVIARLARIFGADKKPDSKAMAQFMDKAVAGEDIVLKSRGNQRFSYCYVADAVSGIFKVLLDGVDGEAYNISEDDEGLTLGGYAEFMASLSDRKVVYDIEDNSAASKSTYALMDTGKLKRLGWEPIYTVSDGLRNTYRIKKSMSDVVH